MHKRPRIFLVDHNPASLSELEQLLAGLDADLVCASSGREAAALAQADEYCAAVVAIELDGRKIPNFSALLHGQPVILVYSAYPDEEAVRNGYASGAADVLWKPLISEVLIGKVKHYMALSEQRAAEKKQAQRRHRKDGEALFQWLSHSMEQIALTLASSLDMVEVPTMVLEQLPEVVPYERGSILLRDGDALRIVAQRGFPPGWPVSDARIPIREGDIFQQIVETGQALLIDDVTQTSAWQQAEGLPLNRSWLGVPLVSKGQVIGMVSLTRREPAAFKPEEVTFIKASASQAAVALVNARLVSDLKSFNEHLEQLVAERTEELNRAYARLQKIDQTKTSFISVVTHELRTPLTLVKGYASLLGMMVKENKDASDLVEGILTGEQRMLDVVNSMVDVSKLDNQNLELRRSMLNLSIIMRILRSEYFTALGERQIELTIRDMESLPAVYGDPELLGKLFRQLVGNAIKYTPDGGAIWVVGRMIPAEELMSGQPESIEITIRDTGIGIDPEQQEVIFEKFYQTGPVELHSSGKTKFKGGGPGLGLAIARGIVLSHGGRIWVESPGYDEQTFPGSCFHIVLPVGAPEPAKSSQ